MKLSGPMQFALQRINTALLERNDAALAASFENVDIPTLLSDEVLESVRARRKPALTILLASLAVSNEINVARATWWLDAFQSISNHALTAGMLRLPANNVFRLSVSALCTQTPLTTGILRRSNGGDQQWVDALELLVDHQDWHSALALLTVLVPQQVQTVRWLQFGKSLTKRQRLFMDESGAAQPDVDYSILAQLFGLIAIASRNAGAHDAVTALRYLQAKSLETAERYDEAIAVLQGIVAVDQTISALAGIARCQCKSGDLAASIATLDKAIPVHANNKEGVEASVFEADTPEEKAKSFNVKSAQFALADLASILNEVDQKFFLVSGTLLGFEREGKLMDHDKDVDVGILGWENQFDICMALQRSGKFTLAAHFLKGTNSYYIPIMHSLTGMWIDLFLYHEVDGQWVTGVDFFFGYRQTFGFTPFELKPVKFLGVDMYVPEDTDLNLTENFGNWRVSDPSYISHLESPSTLHKGELPHMLTARVSAIQAITNRNPHKLRKIVSVMNKHSHDQSAMSAEQCAFLIDLARQYEKPRAQTAATTAAEVAHV